MKSRKILVDQEYIDRQTYWANREAETLIKNVSAFQNDPDQAKRKESLKCKRCFYLRAGGFAGQAFTEQDCGICETTMIFSSTATDVVCPDCAKAHDICVECGGNIEIKVKKKVKCKK
jgi:DNA-directed RNA polymerase subunit RPC12/RpoP